MVHLGYGPYPCSLLNSLEQVLSQKCEGAVFINLQYDTQEIVLQCILKGTVGEELIPLILQSVDEVPPISPRDSLKEKILRYELAPSKVAVHDVMTASKVILAHTFNPTWESPNNLIDSIVETLGEIPIDTTLSTDQDNKLYLH